MRLRFQSDQGSNAYFVYLMYLNLILFWNSKISWKAVTKFFGIAAQDVDLLLVHNQA